MFTWHEAKRRENLRKHGIDLADAERVFEGLTFTVEDDRLPYGEQFGSSQSGRQPDVKRTSTSRKSRTDLKKVGRMRDPDIVRDGDAPEWTPEMFGRAIARKGLKPVPRKALLSLRIDSDVIEWFRAQGAGYQSRMNALLRAYMEAHR